MRASFFVQNEVEFVKKVEALSVRSFDNIKEIVDLSCWQDLLDLKHEALENIPKFSEIVAEIFYQEALIAELLLKHGYQNVIMNEMHLP